MKKRMVVHQTALNFAEETTADGRQEGLDTGKILQAPQVDVDAEPVVILESDSGTGWTERLHRRSNTY
jgi:hypothetical protein